MSDTNRQLEMDSKSERERLGCGHSDPTVLINESQQLRQAQMEKAGATSEKPNATQPGAPIAHCPATDPAGMGTKAACACRDYLLLMDRSNRIDRTYEIFV